MAGMVATQAGMGVTKLVTIVVGAGRHSTLHPTARTGQLSIKIASPLKGLLTTLCTLAELRECYGASWFLAADKVLWCLYAGLGGAYVLGNKSVASLFTDLSKVCR